LGPLLERFAEEYAGKFVLVKADTEKLPQYAAAFNVQGIPAVFALRDGQVVDAFTGLLTEAQLREWIARIVPSEAQTLVKEAVALEPIDAAAAEAKYRQAAELDPRLTEAQIGLARALHAGGKAAEAAQIIEQLEARGFLEPEVQRLKAELQLGSGAIGGEALASLQAAVASAPNDAALKLKLAEALLAGGQYEAGLSLCVEIVAAERDPLRDQARQRMLDAFKVLGEASELTGDFRRQLARVLY
jgi:putative thioredoxin